MPSEQVDLEPFSRAAGVQFELEQFEVIDGDRCEVYGRWLGVRGRRFLRPVLTVTVDGRSRRLLADLAGKPWAAEDDGLWHASFPCALTSTELAGAELSVAPDLTVALQSRRPKRAKSAPGATRAARAPAPPASDESEARPTPSPFERPRAGSAERLRRELVDARSEQRRLQSQVDHLRVEKRETAERITEMIGQTGEVKEELDAVTRGREELTAELQRERVKVKRAAAERDEALFQLEVMTAKRDAVRNDYTELLGRLRAMEAGQQQTLPVRDPASADREDTSAAPVAAIPRSARPSRADDRRPPRPIQRAVPAVALLVITLLVALIVLRP
jgi:hypothetical protein